MASASENQAKNKGRKNGKAPKKPLRGVGVEQLEKQRIEALVRKAEAGTLLHLDHPHQQQQLLKYGAFSPTGPFQFPQHHQQQMMMNENTNNNNNNTVLVGSGYVPFVGACSNVGAGWIVPNNQNQNNNRVVVGGGNYGYGSGSLLCSRNPFEPSKELSSMPNLHHSQPFDLCLKKTRLNEESNVMRGARNPLEAWPNHHHVHDFLGGYVPQPQPQPSVLSAYPTHHNLDECVEVVAVHRRGSSSSGGKDKVFMEYDFFHEKDGRDTSSKNLKFPTIGEAASSSLSLTVSAYGGDTATTDLSSIDLSLKL